LLRGLIIHMVSPLSADRQFLAGGGTTQVPRMDANAGSVLTSLPANAWASVCEGIQQDMMLAILGAIQGMAAACAEVCTQKMQLLHLELVRAVEHELEEAEAKAKRDGQPSTAPIFQSLSAVLSKKTRLGQLCHHEPCMSERQMSDCERRAIMESMHKHLAGTATPPTNGRLKSAMTAGSSPALSESSDPTKHDIPVETPGRPDWTDLTRHDIPTKTPTRPWKPRSEGEKIGVDGMIQLVSGPALTQGKTDADQVVRLSSGHALSSKNSAASKSDWHCSVSSSREQMPQMPQTPQTPQTSTRRGNWHEMAAFTGGAFQESPVAGVSGYTDAWEHSLPQRSRSMVIPMPGGIPLHPPPTQPTQPTPRQRVAPWTADFQQHPLILEVNDRAMEQRAREQQLAKDQNFFYA